MSSEELYRERLRKAEALRAAGIEPWAVRYDPTHSAAELHERFAGLPSGAESGQAVRVAGRLISHRLQGRIAFGDLVDASGKIQLFVTGDCLQTFQRLDTGDILGVAGEVVRTRRGELSVRPGEIVLLAKALRPLPDLWHGLRDVEVRYRHRYLDLLTNPRSREIALIRTRTVRAARAFFEQRGFIEVETPILHPIPGGAAARPFVTHHNALGVDLYLRVAPELYLKRLLVGGFERVYEIGRVFRNEGLGYRWNPEFTMLEAYQAYADYHDVMDTVEAFFREVAEEAVGSTKVSFEGRDIDLGRWRRAGMLELVAQAAGEPVSFDRPLEELRELCARHGVEVRPWWGKGMLVAELYEKLVEPNLWEPTIVYDYPLEVSPLARTHRQDPNLAERFEAIVAGRELANAFSELNDPLEQRRRFVQQQEARAHGDLEANPIDEPYILALEYGMPPAGGLGVGIDRLVMVLAGVHSIREVILFPTLRPCEDGER